MELNNSSNQKAFISVIVPMYNVYDVIDTLLNSLSSQTFKKIEIIFVDDCSSDGTVDKVSSWAENQVFSCNIIRHEKNKGVASARNSGLENATGDYIYFVDADDYIESDALERLYDTAISTGTDIVGCEWYLSFDRGERWINQPDIHNGIEMFIQFSSNTLRWNLWLWLIKRDLIATNNLRFLVGQNMGEDMMLMFKLCFVTTKVTIIHKPYYHYIQTNTASLTKNYHKAIPQITSNIEEISNFIRQQGRQDLLKHIDYLKLSVKLPFLISSNRSDYEIWQNWFPEANNAAKFREGLSIRTFALQYMAVNRQYWFLRLHAFATRLFYKLFYK